MKTLWLAALGAVALLAPHQASAQARYSIKTTGDIVQLRDAATDETVSVLTTTGNAYEFTIKGNNVFRMTYASVQDLRTRPNSTAVPILHPFANRLDETAFYANGQKYNFDMDLGNVRAPVPIHGFVQGSPYWKVVEAKADANGAWVTERLDFYKIPKYMAQFPFAHTLTMTYRLANGSFEVKMKIDNLSDEAMPVSTGFHPYFVPNDSNRDKWTLDIPARTHWKLDSRSIPTGETEPSEAFLGADRHAVALGTRRFDDVFSDLDRDAQGRATVSVTGLKQKISVVFGPKFKTLVMFATPPAALGAAPAAAAAAAPAAPAGPPPVLIPGPVIPLTADKPAPADRGWVAFEPMVGITNAMNAAQKGTYKELQTVAAGASWEESFWVTPSGY